MQLPIAAATAVIAFMLLSMADRTARAASLAEYCGCAGFGRCRRNGHADAGQVAELDAVPMGDRNWPSV